MSSAICFNLDQFKILLSSNGIAWKSINLYNDLAKEALWQNATKCWSPAFFPYPHIVI